MFIKELEQFVLQTVAAGLLITYHYLLKFLINVTSSSFVVNETGICNNYHQYFWES